MASRSSPMYGGNASVETDAMARKKGRQIAMQDEAYGRQAVREQDNNRAHAAVQALMKEQGTRGLPPGAGSSQQSAPDIADTVRRSREFSSSDRPQYGDDKSAAQTATDAKALTDFRNSDPSKVAAQNVSDAAGTGKPVQTPYGPVSSRAAVAGEPMTNMIGDRSLGPQHPSPAPAKDYALQQGKNGGLVPSMAAQQEILAQHPEIGVAGSPENQEFVKQFGEQTKGMKAGDQFSNHLDVASNSVETATPVNPSNPNRVPANPPKTDAQQAGEKVAGAAKTVAGIPAQIGAAADRAVQGVKEFANSATGTTGAGDALSAAGKAVNSIVNPMAPIATAGKLASAGVQALTGGPNGVSKPTGSQVADARQAADKGAAGAYTGAGMATPPANSALARGGAGGAGGLATAASGIPPSTLPPPPPVVPPPAGPPAPGTGTSYADHAAIHAQTVKAITNAGQNAHDALNDAQGRQSVQNTNPDTDLATQHMVDPSLQQKMPSNAAGTGAPMGQLQAPQGNQSSQNVTPSTPSPVPYSGATATGP